MYVFCDLFIAVCFKEIWFQLAEGGEIIAPKHLGVT
jgi:hypothetical protein